VTIPAPTFEDCTGVLVAGGRAARMGGAPKGLLRVNGEPIAARSLALFRRLFGRALVVTNDATPYAALGAPCVPDVLAGRGAPGGLHAALAAAETPWVFAAGCDMPFLDARAISFLAARRAGADAVLVRTAAGLEPLHAFWSRACLPTLEALLAAGQPSFRDLARAVRAEVVEEAEWRTVDPALRSLENANTPEDAARLGLEAGPAGPIASP
jgi:molybdopterin-guanine dinucleotide biosynthesis protein A